MMAWRRPCDKSLSEPIMVCLPTHICVTRPQWRLIRQTCVCKVGHLFLWWFVAYSAPSHYLIWYLIIVNRAVRNKMQRSLNRDSNSLCSTQCMSKCRLQNVRHFRQRCMEAIRIAALLYLFQSITYSKLGRNKNIPTCKVLLLCALKCAIKDDIFRHCHMSNELVSCSFGFEQPSSWPSQIIPTMEWQWSSYQGMPRG